MEASRQHMSNRVVGVLLFVGALGLSFWGFDLLVSEPFGSLMVFSQSASAVAALSVLYKWMERQNDRMRRPVRVRA
jgi:hypothetical protein